MKLKFRVLLVLRQQRSCYLIECQLNRKRVISVLGTSQWTPRWEGRNKVSATCRLGTCDTSVSGSEQDRHTASTELLVCIAELATRQIPFQRENFTEDDEHLRSKARGYLIFVRPVTCGQDLWWAALPKKEVDDVKETCSSNMIDTSPTTR